MTNTTDSSFDFCPDLDDWLEVFDKANREPFGENAFIDLKNRNKNSDQYEMERQQLLRQCRESQWRPARNCQPAPPNRFETVQELTESSGGSADVQIAMISKSPSTIINKDSQDNRMAPNTSHPLNRFAKNSYYVAFMRIVPNGVKEEQVCPVGVEIHYHILFGKATFDYDGRSQIYTKGQNIVLRPRVAYKIHNPKPDQYTYLIYRLKIV